MADCLEEDVVMNTPYLQNKIQEYTKFYNEKLLPELDFALKAEKDTKQEIHHYQDLRQKLVQVSAKKEKEETEGPPLDDGATDSSIEQQQVDLAYGRIYCNAIVDDTTKVYVNVGMGFHVELLIDEALVYTKKRIAMLETILLQRTQSTQRVKDHAQSTENILHELDRELQRVGQ